MHENYQSSYSGIIEKNSFTIPVIKSAQIKKVSAVIITYNEESIIAKTLSRLYWCDEVVIIDSGSTDRTVSICRELGCNVHYKKFQGFGEQKQFGLSKAKNDWILCIDADELLSDDLISEIIKSLSGDINCSGYAIPRNLVFMNQVFKYGRDANDVIIRLFDKKKGAWDGAIVHEKLILNGQVKKLSGKILHFSYNNYNQLFSKINMYSYLGAKKLHDKNVKRNWFLITFGIPFNFFKYYIIYRNFLNGYYGFIWSIMNCYYHLKKNLKLNKLRNPLSQN